MEPTADVPPPPRYTVAQLEKMFVAYGSADPNSGNQSILLAQSDRWMKNAKVFKNMKKITTTDTGIMFFKFRKQKLSFDEYLEFLSMLCDSRNYEVDDMKYLLAKCSPPANNAS